MTPFELIGSLPRSQQLVAATAHEILRRHAPSEASEVARAHACAEFLEAFGVADAEKLVSAWSCEGMESRS